MLSQLRPLSPHTGEEQPLGLYFYHLSIAQGWIFFPCSSSAAPRACSNHSTWARGYFYLILNYS